MIRPTALLLVWLVILVNGVTLTAELASAQQQIPIDSRPAELDRGNQPAVPTARPSIRTLGKRIVLENELLRAVFSAESGSLLQLVAKNSDWQVQRRPDLGCNFRMLVPVPGRRNNPVIGTKQTSPRVRIAATESGWPTLSFAWDKLTSEHAGGLDVDFTGRVTITDTQLMFQAELSNRGEYTVETVDWPYLGDLSLPTDAEHCDHMRLSYCAMLKSPLYPNFKNEAGYWGADCPLQFSKSPAAPFVLADCGNQGLYMGYHDTSLDRMVMFIFRLKPGHEHTDFFTSGTVPLAEEISGEPVRFELSAVHFTYLAGGESAQLHPIVVQPYSGTWHQGADCYKAWRESWHVAPQAPDWTQHVHSWQQIHINSPEDEFANKVP